MAILAYGYPVHIDGIEIEASKLDITQIKHRFTPAFQEQMRILFVTGYVKVCRIWWAK